MRCSPCSQVATLSPNPTGGVRSDYEGPPQAAIPARVGVQSGYEHEPCVDLF
jgi:hypothetical protein